MEIMDFEWRQYDSDVIPSRFFGPPTEARRAAWDEIYDREL